LFSLITCMRYLCRRLSIDQFISRPNHVPANKQGINQNASGVMVKPTITKPTIIMTAVLILSILCMLQVDRRIPNTTTPILTNNMLCMTFSFTLNNGYMKLVLLLFFPAMRTNRRNATAHPGDPNRNIIARNDKPTPLRRIIIPNTFISGMSM